MVLVVALDLEGTLISNAVSAFPRPGLRRFVERVTSVADRTVMFTTVPEPRARDLLRLLEAEGDLPPGFAEAVAFVPCTGPTKDLAAVGAPAGATVLLVDDQRSMVHPGQERSLIPIAEFLPPFTQEDLELDRVAGVIERMRQACARDYTCSPESIDVLKGIEPSAKRPR